MVIQTINLHRMLGDVYCVGYEGESYWAEHDTNTWRARDPHLMIVYCQHGHIYPQGGSELAFASDSWKRGAARKALEFSKLQGARVLNHGDDGVNVAFHVSLLPAALVHFHARRKPQKKVVDERNEHHQVEPVGDCKSQVD